MGNCNVTSFAVVPLVVPFGLDLPRGFTQDGLPEDRDVSLDLGDPPEGPVPPGLPRRAQHAVRDARQRGSERHRARKEKLPRRQVDVPDLFGEVEEGPGAEAE